MAPEGETTIRAAVVRLPERQRLALFLRYYADLDYETIAASTSRPERRIDARGGADPTATILAEEER